MRKSFIMSYFMGYQMFFSNYNIKSQNISLMYIMHFVQGLMFFLPIRALYYEYHLFNLTNVALIFSIEAICLTVFEIPSGAIADLFGRKNSLVLSFIVQFIGIYFLFIGGNMFFFILFALFNAFGRSLLSGTDNAIIYDTLKGEKKEKYFKKVLGKYHALWPFGAALGSIAGGHMATISLGLPVGLTLIPIGLCGIFLLFLKEPKYKKENHKNIFKHMLNSSKLIFKKRQLVLLFFGSFILVGLGEVVHLLNPIFFEFKMVPLALFGYIGALVFGASSLGYFLSHTISNLFGDKKTLIIASLMSPILIFIAVVIVHPIAAVIYATASLFYGLRMPVIQQFVNEDAPSSKRATVLSILNFSSFIGVALLMPFIGYFAQVYSINIAYVISGFIFLIAPVLFLFIKNKHE